jgi:hypothetical protein
MHVAMLAGETKVQLGTRVGEGVSSRMDVTGDFRKAFIDRQKHTA